ncbi:acyl-CoA reductase [Actinoplanes sp. NPDC024001]|uniref:acyl-CoA reductase n=1 Tax=Actinoplanes sp. NPDC024001 TaxID=3154598 RepID=UPI0033F08E25
MTTVRRLLPEAADADVADLLRELTATRAEAPFRAEAMDFCADFAQRLRREARGLPEAQALAFWLRGAGIRRLAGHFAELGGDGVVLVPRGTALHIPPANVDTIFMYSWLLSTLVGNRNVVRLSDRAGEQALLIVDVLRDLFRAGNHPSVQASTAVVQYGHDRQITDALSAACDLRVVWGGDATITEIRRSPLPPHATELTFPDRFSLAVFRAGSYLALDDARRDRLAQRFYNDAYAFDQLGCSSPRLVVWVGDQATAEYAGADLFDRLAEVTRERDYAVATSTAIAKLAYTRRAAIDWPVGRARSYGSRLTVLPLDRYADVRGEFCGGGVFFQFRVGSLGDLASRIDRRDQTLVQFGFEAAELTGLVRELNGRGIDRVVPVGEALTFHHIWDGHDLLQSFTRRTTIDLTEAHLT